LEDELFETDPLLKDLKAIRDVEGYTEFPPMTVGEIKELENKYYGPGGELRDLAHLKKLN
jgi:hypothetical protein